jgi:exopolysaccharide production protein ExoQ
MNTRAPPIFGNSRRSRLPATQRNPWLPDDRYAVFLALMLWILVVYVSIPGNILVPPQAKGLDDMTANPLSRSIKLTLIGVSCIFIMWKASLSWLLVRWLNVFFLLFLVLVPVSVLWSIDPGATSARFISLMSMVLVSFAFTLSGWHPHRFQAVVRPILTLLIFGSLVFGVIAPQLAIEDGEGTLKNSWHGLMSQKNQLGQLASFGVVFWLHAWLSGQARKLTALLCGGAAFLCLLLSRSSTSLLSTMFVCVLLLLLLRSPSNLRRLMPLLIAVFVGLFLTYALAVLKLVPGLEILLTPITAFTGKDMTFSNRSEIWLIIKEHIQLSPYIGTGYGAFWTGPVPSSASYVFLGRMYFYPTESHNGYLEIVNDLGFLGMAVLFGYLIVFVAQSLRLMKIDRYQGALFLALFFQQIIINLSETAWLSANAAFTFTVMTAATMALGRSLLADKLQSFYTAVPSPEIPRPIRRNLSSGLRR